MSKTLLDTDIYSEILRAVNPIVIGHARSYRQTNGVLTLSVISMPKIARLSLVFLLASGCGGGQGRAPIPSPDGSMTLHTRIEQSRNDPVTYLCVVFEIRDSSGRILHTENTRASNVMRWKMAWVADDRIRLESSDIGTYEWKRQADGSWVKEQAAKASAGRHA